MIDHNFSLTKQLVIDPTLYLRAEPSNFISKELGARVTALFTSIFAAADCFIHLTAGLCKGGYALLQEASLVPRLSVSPRSADAHLSAAWFFAKVAAGGSIAGLINPKALVHFEKNFAPVDNSCSSTNLVIQEFIRKLGVCPNDQLYSEIREFWKDASLQDKSELVQAIRAQFLSIHPVYAELKDLIFRSVDPDRESTWTPYPRLSSALEHSFYYHATSKEALMAILKSQKIEVRHEKMYKGAFVSTKPEYHYGDYILALRPNIERLSSPEHSFRSNTNTQWTGFSRPVPINTNSLACIIFNNSTPLNRVDLRTELKTLTGRDIEVVPSPGQPPFTLMGACNQGIPKEWGNDNHDLAVAIMGAPIVPQTTLQEDLKAPFFDGYEFVMAKVNALMTTLSSATSQTKLAEAYDSIGKQKKEKMLVLA